MSAMNSDGGINWSCILVLELFGKSYFYNYLYNLYVCQFGEVWNEIELDSIKGTFQC